VIQLRALGPLQVAVNGAPAPADLMWSRNLALLLYLARAPAHRCTRDHAIGLLWPEKDQALARQSLREAVRTLRRYIGEDHLHTPADQLELIAGAVELDTDRFDACVAAGDWAGATPLVTGKFAEGFVLPDASTFEDWLHAERWHWHGRMMDALIQHAEQRIAAGDLRGADEPARRAHQLDPLSDRALRTLMRRLALAGDRSAALALYAETVERIAREHAAPLDQETEALAERLRRGREWKLPPDALAAEQSVTWRRAPLIGRETELAALDQQWRKVRTGGGRLGLALIEAVPGGGKTRLAEELMARAALDGAVCVATRAVPDDQRTHLSGLLAVARGGLLDAPGVAGASPAALAAIAHEVSEWAERFPAAARTPSAQPLGPALTEVLRVTSAEQPMVLVLDDAHWLDDASLGSLDVILRDLAAMPLLIVLAAVPEPTTEKLAELRARIGRETPGAVVRPGPFGDDELLALVRWAFPQFSAEQQSRLSRRIAVDSAGVPLLAVEICQAIAQGLDLEATSGAWPRPLRTLDQTMPGDLPETIVAAIRVSFNCLSPPAQAALRAAAVLGDRVGLQRIGKAAGLENAARDAALDELEWRRWLLTDTRGYSFVARIVRDVVRRDMVTEGQRQRILSA
jgi:DNA-binding SARP family transcriptional activator